MKGGRVVQRGTAADVLAFHRSDKTLSVQINLIKVGLASWMKVQNDLFPVKVLRRCFSARDVAADTDAADGPHGLGMQ